jgi:hypothetical protein
MRVHQPRAQNGWGVTHSARGRVTISTAAGPGLRPLEPPAIEQILVTLRGLPRSLLEEFTAGFRRRFQVPADATTIADRITQQHHHDWIEAFLVQHQHRADAAVRA